jgi:hypothetical protein
MVIVEWHGYECWRYARFCDSSLHTVVHHYSPGGSQLHDARRLHRLQQLDLLTLCSCLKLCSNRFVSDASFVDAKGDVRDPIKFATSAA